MGTHWDNKSWRKDFLNMKSHSPSDAKLLIGGVKGLKDAWRLGVLHLEYERLKKIQEDQQQQQVLSGGLACGLFARMKLNQSKGLKDKILLIDSRSDIEG